MGRWLAKRLRRLLAWWWLRRAFRTREQLDAARARLTVHMLSPPRVYTHALGKCVFCGRDYGTQWMGGGRTAVFICDDCGMGAQWCGPPYPVKYTLTPARVRVVLDAAEARLRGGHG